MKHRKDLFCENFKTIKMIWFKPVDLKMLNDFHKNTMPDYLGIEFTEIGDDYIKARMPVNEKTMQAQGRLHGGANVVLAESLGSIATVLSINPDERKCVGLEINANHIRGAFKGYVHGITRPVHLGRTTQIWEIKIYDDDGKL